MINSKVRSEVTKLVTNIETLAARVRTALTSGLDPVASSNELVATTMTLTFSLGELYALETVPATKSVPTTKAPQTRYHNVRDNHGRFTRVSSVLP